MSELRRDPKQLLAAQPDISVWVSANAGAGKTQVLVNRIARLLLAGAEPASILCLTYTNAAAAEMAARIFKTLGEWTSLSDARLRQTLEGIGVEQVSARDLKRARRLFALALDTPGGFKIQTIHGFCERILQLFPIEAGMAPGFAILDDKQRKDLLQQARDVVLSAASTTAGSELATALDFVSHYTAADSLDGMLDEVLRNGGTLLAGDNYHPGMINDLLRQFFGIEADVSLAELRHEILDADYEGFASSAAILATGGVRNQALGLKLQAIGNEKNPDNRLRLLAETIIAKGKDGLKPPTVYATEPPEMKPVVEAMLAREYARLLPLMQRHDELLRIAATQALMTIAKAVHHSFTKAKASQAAYDFDDLISKTRELLTDKEASAWVLFKLDRAVEHVLVDEAQDTSPPQWQIMQALTEEFFAGEGRERQESRTVFVVGDQKQSIFSFQGADVRIFENSRAFFQARVAGAGQVMENVPLTISYRSQDAVLQSVDAVFAAGMPARSALGIADTEGLSHVAERKDTTGIVELWPLTVAGGKDVVDPWAAPARVREAASPQRVLAGKIAATIASWIGKRWLPHRSRTVQPADILLLFRKRSRMFDLLIAALREAGVAVAGTDRLKPVENIGVEDMLALMRVVTLPADDYALACVLKSPLVSKPVSEEELFDLCHGRGSSSLWSQLAASSASAAQTCFGELQAYRDAARTLRPFDFIQHVLLQRRKSILARLGREADDALAALAEQALTYEAKQAASISGFAEWFRAEDSEIKRDMESGGGEVRLMTVHGAKGLEADIVFLPDAANGERSPSERLLFVDPAGGEGEVPLWKLSGFVPSPALEALKADLKVQEHSEYSRLLYVAMTRARDELYICGASDKDEAPEGSWYEMIEAALPGMDGIRTVTAHSGEAVLRLGAEPMWRSDEPRTTLGKTSLPDCLQAAVARLPSVERPVTPSLLAHPDGTVLSPERARAGSVIHRMLERLPTVEASQRRSFVERQLARGKVDGGMADRLLQMLEMPEVEALFGPGSSGEASFGATLPDGRRMSGAIDRLVVREQDVLVVDYKSDRLPPERLRPGHPHLRQLAAYCYGLQIIYPGRAVKAAILWLAEGRLEWVGEAEMQEAIAELTGQPSLSQP